MAQTGRFFKCLSLKGELSKQTQDYFEIGKIYAEADLDLMGDNLCQDDSFLLYSDARIALCDENEDIVEMSPMLYVSAMDFELVNGVIQMNYN